MNWPGFVPDQLTPMAPAEAVAVLEAALAAELGRLPSHRATELLAAQSALETAKWRSMHNFNFGNIRGSFAGKWTSFGAGEVIDGKEVLLEPGPDNRFRAYPSADAGARDLVRLIASRYPEAWRALERGDAAGFVGGLKRRGYFTASEALYRRAVNQHASALASVVRGGTNGAPSLAPLVLSLIAVAVVVAWPELERR